MKMLQNESFFDASSSVTPASLDPLRTATGIHLCKIQDPVNYKKEFDSMLALAWIECFLPIFLWVGNCVFAGVGDKKFKLAGTALCGLLSLIAGPMYLTWYYQCPQAGSSKPKTMQNCFKTHVSLSLGCVILGALAVVQVVFVFLRVLMCAECGKGFRLRALLGAIFMITITALVTFIPLGSVAIGWKYAFGDCFGILEWETIALNCEVNNIPGNNL
ncbi:unnamed protein product [Oikopleura dioica]|uniref:Uncharacterized protein n=2 Tax=Oikopleura dioica TaxID=34765 RepID=E4XTL7_OIKDI|nr:unnamed protein product [Oikopleura dioica]